MPKKKRPKKAKKKTARPKTTCITVKRPTPIKATRRPRRSGPSPDLSAEDVEAESRQLEVESP